jgi:hypothetical protein
MAEELQELDLLNPGKLWATAEHQKDVTFHILFPDKEATKEKCKEAIDPGLDMIQPMTVPFTACDANGVATFDLEGTGRAADMLNNLTKYYAEGGENIATVKAVVFATAREGNKIPEKTLVDIMEMNLLAVPIIMLKPTKAYVTVQQFKGGMKNFEAEVKFKGPITEAEFSMAPDVEFEVAGKKGKGKQVIPVKEGETYKISMPVPFVQGNESRQVAVPRTYQLVYPWGWRRGEVDYRSDTREKWTGGKWTLTIAGTKANAKVKQSCILEAVDWGAEWLVGPPPPPFYHNNC